MAYPIVRYRCVIGGELFVTDPALAIYAVHVCATHLNDPRLNSILLTELMRTQPDDGGTAMKAIVASKTGIVLEGA